MAQLNMQKIAQFDNNKGKAYMEILDIAKMGKLPISREFYNKNRQEIRDKFFAYLPCASDLHGSFAPQGVSFRDANQKYGSRYEGYNVSEDSKTGEKILFPLAKELPDAKGNAINVLDAQNHVILVKLESINGKPTIEYEHDKNKNETLLSLNSGNILCTSFPTNGGYYELQNNIFVKSDSSNPNANYLYRVDGKNWNGLFALGFGYDDRVLVAGHLPSGRLGVLGKENMDVQAEVKAIISGMQANTNNYSKLEILANDLVALLQNQ